MALRTKYKSKRNGNCMYEWVIVCVYVETIKRAHQHTTHIFTCSYNTYRRDMHTVHDINNGNICVPFKSAAIFDYFANIQHLHLFPFSIPSVQVILRLWCVVVVVIIVVAWVIPAEGFFCRIFTRLRITRTSSMQIAFYRFKFLARLWNDGSWHIPCGRIPVIWSVCWKVLIKGGGCMSRTLHLSFFAVPLLQGPCICVAYPRVLST